MTDDANKTSSLATANSIAANDRIMFVHIPSVGNPTTRTIKLSLFVANGFPLANSSSPGVVKVGNNLTINASGHLSTNGVTNSVSLDNQTLYFENGILVDIQDV